MNFNLSELLQGWNISLSGALSALATLAVCLVVSRLACKALRRLLTRSRLDPRMQKYLLSAIRAALYPDSTDYYFYALGNDGVHHFFRTYNEHVNFLNSLED